MNAIVSGRSGRALIIEGDSLKSFEVNDPSRIVPRQKADLPYLFGEAADLRILENTNLESVQRELRNDRNFTWALDLTLISLDSELPQDIRKKAILELEELFANGDTVEQVESVMYAEALPETADIKGTLELCSATKTSQRFLRRLEESQTTISAISLAWESIPIELFGSSQYRDEFRAVAVREGLFRAMVLDLLPSGALSPSIQKLPDYEDILETWQNRSLIALHLGAVQSSYSTAERRAIRKRIKALKEAGEKKFEGAALYRKRKLKRKGTSEVRDQKVPNES